MLATKRKLSSKLSSRPSDFVSWKLCSQLIHILGCPEEDMWLNATRKKVDLLFYPLPFSNGFSMSKHLKGLKKIVVKYLKTASYYFSQIK